jgi:hypothetical protein
MAMIDSGLGWTCDSDYYVSAAGTTLKPPLIKTNNGGAMCAIVKWVRSGWFDFYCAYIVSTVEDNVAVHNGTEADKTIYSTTYGGRTWYISCGNNDSSVYSGTLPIIDASEIPGYWAYLPDNAQAIVQAITEAASIEFYKIIPSTDYVKAFVEGVEAETATRVNANKASIGTLSTLTTTAKNSAVSAINEVNTKTSDLYAILGTYGSDVYGLQIDFENYIYTRLAGAAGKSRSFFDTVAPWKDMKRCNLADDGTVNAYYGDADYIEDGTNGQVMVEIPKFYYKMAPLKLDPIEDSVGGYHTRKANYYISATKYEGFKTHPAFVKPDGTERDKAYVSAYEGCIYDVSASAYLLADEQIADFTASTGDKLSSIANAKPCSGLTQQLTKPNSEILATNRGTGWHCMDIKAVSALQWLFMIEYGTLNSQNAIGLGVINGNEPKITGTTSSLGNSTGMASGTNGLVSVSYRGVENPYGNIWKFTEGLTLWGDGTLRGGQPYICDDYNFVEGTKAGYTAAKFTITNAKGYISAFGCDPDFDWLFLPSECVNADSNYPIGDYTYVASDLNGYRSSLLGARWDFGVLAGVFCWALNYVTGGRSQEFSARLMYVS